MSLDLIWPLGSPGQVWLLVQFPMLGSLDRICAPKMLKSSKVVDQCSLDYAWSLVKQKFSSKDEDQYMEPGVRGWGAEGMQFVIVENASKQFCGQWAVSYLGIIEPVGLPKDCWGCGSYYGAQRGVAVWDYWQIWRSVSCWWAVSYVRFLDPAWPLVKTKSSSKVVGWVMGSRSGVQFGIVEQALRNVSR